MKIRQKFIKKKVFFEALISYRYRIVSRKKPSYRIDIVSSRKKAYRSGVVIKLLFSPKNPLLRIAPLQQKGLKRRTRGIPLSDHPLWTK